MTVILPFHVTERARQAGFRRGRVFYGPEVRDMLTRKPSIPDRMIEWYCARLWPHYLLIGFGITIFAATMAAWIVL